MKISSNEIFEAKIYLPLFLIFWIPQTILILLAIYYEIRWVIFGNTKGITKWYTDNFKSLHEALWWIAKDIGIIGCSLILILIVSYLWLSRKIWIAIFITKK